MAKNGGGLDAVAGGSDAGSVEIGMAGVAGRTSVGARETRSKLPPCGPSSVIFFLEFHLQGNLPRIFMIDISGSERVQLYAK